MDGELLERLKGAKDAYDVMKIASEKGASLSSASAIELFKRIHSIGEISDDELDYVSGGAVTLRRVGI